MTPIDRGGGGYPRRVEPSHFGKSPRYLFSKEIHRRSAELNGKRPRQRKPVLFPVRDNAFPSLEGPHLANRHTLKEIGSPITAICTDRRRIRSCREKGPLA